LTRTNTSCQADGLRFSRDTDRDVGRTVSPSSTAKQLDAVQAIGDLDRFDRFAAPAKLWEDLRTRFPELLTSG